MATLHKPAHEYDWGLYPEAEEFLKKEIERFLKNNNLARHISEKIQQETSTKFFDWIDHIVLPEKEISDSRLRELGFERGKLETEGMRVFLHSKTVFFPVLLTRKNYTEIALKPERIDHFLQVIGRGVEIEGGMFSPYRKAVVHKQGSYILSSVERNGYNGFVAREPKDNGNYKQALEAFFCRQRHFESDREGMKDVQELVEKTLNGLASARVADAFFRAERLYWERRNSAGQMQKARQDRLGLGWGNHDHHTYRSSREHFTHLIKIFETMGYECREQFYAGPKAGWGAQILEHPVCNIVLFADVDITEHEKNEDFAHHGLHNIMNLGTVGLWVALHGESILQAGMHHLEARFDFEKLRQDLQKIGVNVLPPFSYFDFLKQAFVQSDIWKVEEKRLKHLLKNKSITKAQYEKFLREGATGSHLENLQRRQGFKGFNQDSVTAIIKATDPRIYKGPDLYTRHA